LVLANYRSSERTEVSLMQRIGWATKNYEKLGPDSI
jgi:hypothetical protein